MSHTAGSLYSENLCSGSAQFCTYSSAHSPPSGTQSYPPVSSSQPGGQPVLPPSSSQPYPLHYGSQYHVPPPLQPNYNTGTKCPQYIQQPYSGMHPTHSHSAPLNNADISLPNYLSPLNCDDEEMDFSFNDQLHPTPSPLPPSSPSPSITPPPQTEFTLPPALQVSHHDSCAAFGMSDPKVFKVQACIGCISIIGKPRQVKEQWLYIKGQVNRLNEEIKNAQLDMITWKELQNKCYMAKYNLTHQVNEHKFLKAKYIDNHIEAATTHKCGLEAKDSGIHLHEAETKMHDALAHAHAEERTTLDLKIKYAHLTSSSSRS
ncbi:hypothetical protein DFH29DRAFT_1007122 [Suillus ampliporus]|nr:hypothetical protein DFH29DRAFT_1007122 [Suillus ampliporus]